MLLFNQENVLPLDLEQVDFGLHELLLAFVQLVLLLLDLLHQVALVFLQLVVFVLQLLERLLVAHLLLLLLSYVYFYLKGRVLEVVEFDLPVVLLHFEVRSLF